MKKFDLPLPALQLLEALAERETLSLAASEVGLSQSAASHALATLEKKLGAPLVVRTSGALRLSETGRRLLPHIGQIHASLAAIRDEVSGLAALQRGVLRVGAVPSLAATFVPRLMRRFHALYPGIDVSLFEGTDDEVAEWVRTRVVDTGFAALPASGVAGEEVARDEWLAVVPASDFAGQSEVALAALARRRFLLSGGGCEVHIRQLFRDAGMDLPPHLAIRGIATIHTMVAERLGVSLLPELALRGAPKGLRALSLLPRQERRIGLLTPAGGRPSPAVEAWRGLTRSYFSGKSR